MADTVMPIASSRGRAVKTRLAFETAAGTLATAGWKPVRFYDVTAGMDRPLEADEQLGLANSNDRDAGESTEGMPGGSLRRVVPINLVEAGYWLSSGFRRAAPTGADGDFVHVFDSGFDPSNTLSLAHQWENGDCTWDVGAAMAELQISAQKNAQRARMTMTHVGLQDGEGAAWPAGAVAAAAPKDDFANWRWRVLWNDVGVGTALNIDVNMMLGVERLNLMSGDEFPSGHHFGATAFTGSFRLYGRGAAFRELGRTKEKGKLTLLATMPSDPENRYLRFDMFGSQFNKPQNSVSGGGQQSSDFSYVSSQDADNNAVKITLANGVAGY